VYLLVDFFAETDFRGIFQDLLLSILWICLYSVSFAVPFLWNYLNLQKIAQKPLIFSENLVK